MASVETIITKKQSLLRSTSLVSLMTFFSRVMGFARDMILAYAFGAQAGMDAFYVAFRIPNFMRRLFAEGAFSQAFVPVLAEYQQNKSVGDVRLFIARIAGHLGAVLSLVTLIGIVFAPAVIFLFAPGFGEGSMRNELATEMLRLTFPYLMLISLTAMAGAVLNTYGYFGIPAFTPVLLNISMIVAALFLAPKFNVPVKALAWGVLLAGMIQFLFQLPFLYQRRLLVRPKIYWADEGVRKVLKLMIPALFGVSVAQLNLMVDSIFASFLKVGSVSWLYYTDRLTDFPLGVFGVAIATVILPHLSRKHAEQNSEKYSKALDWGLRAILLIGLPAGVGLVFFSMPMIASCFGYGAFTTNDIVQTQKSLIALALGVPAFMLIKVLASGFYAQQDIKTPVKIGAWAMVVNSLLCALLIFPLAHAGLTLASTLAGYVNAGLLCFLLIRRGFYQRLAGWRAYVLRLILANAVMAFYLTRVSGAIEDWIGLAVLHRIGLLLFHVIVAAGIYALTLLLLGIKPSQFRGAMKE